MNKVVHGFLLALLIAAPSIEVFASKDIGGACVFADVIAAAILLTRLPNISSFHLLSLTVRLQKQTKQVGATLTQLQKMAAAFAEANLNQLAMHGQMLSRLSTESKFSIHDQIIKSLKAIKISADDISKAQRTWIFFYGCMILDRIDDAVKLLPEYKGGDESTSLPKDPIRNLPTPEVVRDWAATSLKNAAIKKLMQEYTSVWTTGSMKDPSVIPFNQILRGQR